MLVIIDDVNGWVIWPAEVDIRFVEGVQDEEEEQDDDDEDLASCNPWSRRVAIATADRIYMSKPLDSPTNGISRVSTPDNRRFDFFW